MCPYPPQGAGVASFLGLLDTPASFATEAQKIARVNVAEDALEFATGWGVPINPVHTTDIIFGPAAKGPAFENLDVLVGPCIAFLKVEVAGADVCAVDFRRPGDTTTTGVTIGHTNFTAGHRVGYVLVVTDAAGIVEWMDNTGNAVTVTRLAYWPDPPIVDATLYAGNGTGAYEVLNCGLKNCLVILRISSTAGGFWRGFRMRGETTQAGNGCTMVYAAAVPVNGHIIIPTNADGEMEWFWPAANNITITLVTYIAGAIFPRQAIFRGAVPQVMTDLPTPFGRGFALVKYQQIGVPADHDLTFRQNGEAGLVNGAPQVCAAGISLLNLDDICYAFVPLDEYGVVEWDGGPGDTGELTVEAVTR